MNRIVHKCTTSQNSASIFLEYCSEHLRSGMYEHIPTWCFKDATCWVFLFVVLFQ